MDENIIELKFLDRELFNEFDYNIINIRESLRSKLKIKMKSKNYGHEMEIGFPETIYTYCVIKTLDRFENQENLFTFNNILYEVENSKLLIWFEEETYGIYSRMNLHHYLIIGKNRMVEVISETPPVITKEKYI